VARPSIFERIADEDYVFISHSSRDTDIMSAVKQAFVDLPVKPYFVEEKPAGAPPTKEIADQVKNASAIFIFFTSNSVYGETRDWIAFEIGIAMAHRIPIFAWKQRHVQTMYLPRLLEQVSTHRDFEMFGEGIISFVKDVRNAVKRLS
jgi:hypothetical protein